MALAQFAFWSSIHASRTEAQALGIWGGQNRGDGALCSYQLAAPAGPEPIIKFFDLESLTFVVLFI
jgi:hypothetical protein